MNRQRDLGRQVLQHLEDRKEPINWDVLCIRFDPNRTEDIRAVLDNLKDWGHIALDEQGKTIITEIGKKRLDGRY